MGLNTGASNCCYCGHATLQGLWGMSWLSPEMRRFWNYCFWIVFSSNLFFIIFNWTISEQIISWLPNYGDCWTYTDKRSCTHIWMCMHADKKMGACVHAMPVNAWVNNASICGIAMKFTWLWGFQPHALSFTSLFASTISCFPFRNWKLTLFSVNLYVYIGTYMFTLHTTSSLLFLSLFLVSAHGSFSLCF